jgi:hypothetical protein
MSKRINLSIFFFILIGYLAQVEECSTPEEEEKLICAKGQSKATSPLVCRDARLRLAVIAGLPTKNCHLVNTHFSALAFNFNFTILLQNSNLKEHSLGIIFMSSKYFFQDCTTKLAFLPIETHVSWIKTRLTL